jgi:protein-tyrosine-phosphatase
VTIQPIDPGSCSFIGTLPPGRRWAEGILRDRSRRAVGVYSAGMEPVGVHPPVARALQEMGVDISSRRSNHDLKFAGETFDFAF